jgi:hypothetical protein
VLGSSIHPSIYIYVNPVYVVQIVYCAGSRVAMAVEYNRTENIGIGYIARAWLDKCHARAQWAKATSAANKNILAHFSKPEAQASWNILFCGPLDPREQPYVQDTANVLVSEDNKRLAFMGARLCCSCVARM